jgi:uncharacterized protein
MALQLDSPTGGNVIHRVEPDCVWINGKAWTESVIVPWQGPVTPWGVKGFDALRAEDFERLLALRPELILFGSGPQLRFAHPALYRAVIDARIGLDTMDLAAACRTFTVLTSEHRQATAALLLN